MKNRPIPGHWKTYSVMISPPATAPMSMPSCVVSGIRAVRTPWRKLPRRQDPDARPDEQRDPDPGRPQDQRVGECREDVVPDRDEREDGGSPVAPDPVPEPRGVLGEPRLVQPQLVLEPRDVRRGQPGV